MLFRVYPSAAITRANSDISSAVDVDDDDDDDLYFAVGP